MPAVETLHATDHHVDDDEPFVLDLGLHSGFGDEWLKFGAVKIFADGSLIGRTAAMSPFSPCVTRPRFISFMITKALELLRD